VRQTQARPLHKLHADGALWSIVSHLLSWLWSPAQIARTLRTMWPYNPELHVSYETIYNAEVRFR
jgi:IS30 family transposase